MAMKPITDGLFFGSDQLMLRVKNNMMVASMKSNVMVTGIRKWMMLRIGVLAFLVTA